MGCVGAILFVVCETTGLGTKLDLQDTDEEQILSALRRARIGSRRQIALSAPGSGAQLGATAPWLHGFGGDSHCSACGAKTNREETLTTIHGASPKVSAKD